MGVSITAHEDRFIRFFDNNTGKKYYFLLYMKYVLLLILLISCKVHWFVYFCFQGKQIHSMVAHLDAVTCLSVDSPGLYLLSGSKYCSVPKASVTPSALYSYTILSYTIRSILDCLDLEW